MALPADGVEVAEHQYSPLTEVADLLDLVLQLGPGVVELAEPAPDVVVASIDAPVQTSDRECGVPLDVLMKQVEDGIDVPPRPEVEQLRVSSALSSDIRLLPQSGGFEGLSVVVDGSQFGHLVPRKCEKPSHRLVELHTSGAAPEVDRSKPKKALLRRVPELVDGDVPILELIIDLREIAPHAVVAVIRGIRHLRMDYDVVVENSGVNLPLSGVPAVELPADQLLAASDHSIASIPAP